MVAFQFFDVVGCLVGFQDVVGCFVGFQAFRFFCGYSSNRANFSDSVVVNNLGFL